MVKALRFPGGALPLGKRPLVMGILNVTPDSFSDGGRYLDPGLAVERAGKMAEEGADIVDVGGESTRPGAGAVDEEEERRRVLPVIRRLHRELKVPLSIDSSKPGVVADAVEAGARMINDVCGLESAAMRKLAAAVALPVVIMHMQGRPRDMQKRPRYRDVVREVAEHLRRRVAEALQAGVKRERIIVDPGIGFGKKLEHNLALLNAIPVFKRLGLPVLIGASRKSLLGVITGRPVEARLAGSLTLVCVAAGKGADILRVHDVGETRDVLKVLAAMERGKR